MLLVVSMRPILTRHFIYYGFLLHTIALKFVTTWQATIPQKDNLQVSHTIDSSYAKRYNRAISQKRENKELQSHSQDFSHA